MFKKLTGFYEHFYQTLAEGHYQAEPLTLWSLFKPNKQKMPGTTHVEVGTRMIDTSSMLGKRMMWAAVFAALSVSVMQTTALVLGVIGIGLLAMEYNRSKKAGQDVITEINFAGQKVQGKRCDLYRLHKAQEQIMKLSDSFKQASMESTTDTIERIMKGVTEERKRVKVVDSGRFNAGLVEYEFSEPAVKLIDDENGKKISRAPQPAAPFFNRKAALTDEQVADHLVALHEALPPHLAERVQAQLAKSRLPAPPVPALIPAPAT